MNRKGLKTTSSILSGYNFIKEVNLKQGKMKRNRLKETKERLLKEVQNTKKWRIGLVQKNPQYAAKHQKAAEKLNDLYQYIESLPISHDLFKEYNVGAQDRAVNDFNKAIRKYGFNDKDISLNDFVNSLLRLPTLRMLKNRIAEADNLMREYKEYRNGANA